MIKYLYLTVIMITALSVSLLQAQCKACLLDPNTHELTCTSETSGECVCTYFYPNPPVVRLCMTCGVCSYGNCTRGCDIAASGNKSAALKTGTASVKEITRYPWMADVNLVNELQRQSSTGLADVIGALQVYFLSHGTCGNMKGAFASTNSSRAGYWDMYLTPNGMNFDVFSPLSGGNSEDATKGASIETISLRDDGWELWHDRSEAPTAQLHPYTPSEASGRSQDGDPK